MLAKIDTFAPPTPALEAARRRAFVAAWAAASLFLLLQVSSNAFSERRDLPNLNPYEPFVWEYSSAIVAILLLPAIGWLTRIAPAAPGRWVRSGLIHFAGSIGFCLLHVGGFVLVRKAVYALAGARYGRADLVYEYRKDVVSYIGFALIFGIADWAAKVWARSRVPATAAEKRLYSLRDGSRIERVPLDEIVAVTSARNYVEFHLADGTTPLVRETLAKVEADLAAAGFLRTHRSWLVNPAHVRAMTAAAAGDFRLELAGKVTAPLSRRFPQALAALCATEGSPPSAGAHARASRAARASRSGANQT
jgi:hypothetical protein